MCVPDCSLFQTHSSLQSTRQCIRSKFVITYTQIAWILRVLFATVMAVVLMKPPSLLHPAKGKATSFHRVTALCLPALLATTARTRSVSPVPLFVSPALALLLLSAWLALVIVI